MRVWIIKATMPDGRQRCGGYPTEEKARAEGARWKAEGCRDVRLYIPNPVPGDATQ